MEEVIAEITEQCRKIEINATDVVQEENKRNVEKLEKLEEPVAMIKLMQVR